MNLQETDDLCWAARHSLMDIIAFESIQVKDKMGMIGFIEEMNDDNLQELTQSLLQLESMAPQLLEHEYDKYLRESRSDLSISNMDHLHMRDTYLSESKEVDDKVDQFTQMAKTGSLLAVVSAYSTWALTHQDLAAEANKKMATNIGSAWTKAVRKIPQIHKLVDPETYEIEKLKKIRTQANNKVGASSSLADKTKIISNNKNVEKKIAKKARIATKNSKVAKAHRLLKKGGERLMETPEAKDARKALEKSKRIAKGMNTGSKAAIIAGSITVSALVAYGIYKKLTDPAKVACSNQTGKMKTACILRYKIKAATEAVRVLEKGMQGCDQKPDPQKCQYSFNKQIWNWNKRKAKYQEKLAKLAQNKSQFRTHSKL